MKICKTLISVALLFVATVAVGDPGSVVYRGIDGELTKESVQNLKSLRKIARKNGGITVWISFGVTFQPDPALRTPEVVAREAAMRDQMVAEVIVPLIRQGWAWSVDGPPLNTQAPGVLLNISHQGLHKLSKNPKVKHIGHLPAE